MTIIHGTTRVPWARSRLLSPSLMLPATRWLSFILRADLRPSGRLLVSRPPLIPKPPLVLNALRQFSSTRPQNVKYVPFEVDPEQPLNYRRWSTGTQVFGGIVVLSVVYYVLQYVSTFTRHICARPLSHMLAVLKLYPKLVGGDSWTSVQNSRPGYVLITNQL